MPTSLERDAPGCLYTTTAGPAVPAPALRTDATAQVVVVGAGYTGLSAALHLAERQIAVTVIEAHEPGWGAAGRNGGQVNAGLKYEPDDVERDLGPVYGPRLVRLAGEAPEYLFKLIERLGIDCEARREGTLRVARHKRHGPALRISAEQWARRGVDIEVWDKVRIASATGTHRYAAAAFDARGGSVNPLGLARGLTAAASRAGASIHGDTRALRLERNGSGWSVVTPDGTVRADKVILATDGYSDDLWPGLRTSIVPIYSSIIATAPLPLALAAAVLPHGSVVYESGDVTIYYRRDAGNRLLMGGRGRQQRATERSDYVHLARYAESLWPALAAVEWTHWWNGQFALTPDFYPRLHVPMPNLFIALGYSGRGVALGMAMGAQVAAASSGAELDTLDVPVTPIPQIPFHGLWRAGVALRVASASFWDRIGL